MAPAHAPRERFEALLFDWDGTAVPDRASDAGAVRRAIEAACACGLEVAVVSGTHVDNVDGQLTARPAGPGELHLLLNRGSEVFRAHPGGVELVQRRTASAQEEAALDRAAELTVSRLGERGVAARVVSRRLNRRKIDLIPRPEWADPPKARIGELLAAVEELLREHALDGLRDVVRLSEAAAREAGLPRACVTTDAKHVEIGLTDKADSARWCFEHLWRRGVWPQQTLIVGDELGDLGGVAGSDSKLIDRAARATVVSVGVEPAGVPAGVLALGGGPARFLQLLEHQVHLRRAGALPLVPEDPTWTLRVEEVEHERERAHESLLALADGRLGTRGSLLTPTPASSPGAVIAGEFRGRGELSELQPVPLWNRLAPPAAGEADGWSRVRRTLDLRTGLLTHDTPGGPVALQLSSLARPGTAVLRALGPRRQLEESPALVAPTGEDVQLTSHDGTTRARIALDGHVLEAAAAQRIDGPAERATLERVAAYAATPAAAAGRPAVELLGVARPAVGRLGSARPAVERLGSARAAGVERLLCEHRRAWAERWERADVRIEGDPELQLAVRLALHHLMGSAADGGEAAVGARGLSGKGYRGHVFWDSDVFVLPFLAATHPAGARAILQYRIRRLPAARAAARAAGLRGARFAWESAADGADVTPRSVRDHTGREVTIHTGEREEHIVADVAWAAACYVDWTGDETFRTGPGRELLVETARYWASRVERDPDGSAHIRGVIGPDEYHEQVDDNAFTNAMARWNLRRAQAETTDADVAPGERGAWLQIAAALVDGYRPDRGLHEQFAGFFALEPLVISQLAPRPIAADQLLGPERVHGAQVVKQADVLMLHHLLPDEPAPGSLARDLDFYEPRTAHGSSLSPGIHAALFARAGRLHEALAALALAARIDLDDVSASTAAGVHVAAMGSVWQALAHGFAGARPLRDALALDPRLPAEWRELELRLSFRGARLAVRIAPGELEVRADRPTPVRVAGADPVTVDGGAYRCAWS